MPPTCAWASIPFLDLPVGIPHKPDPVMANSSPLFKALLRSFLIYILNNSTLHSLPITCIQFTFSTIPTIKITAHFTHHLLQTLTTGYELGTHIEAYLLVTVLITIIIHQTHKFRPLGHPNDRGLLYWTNLPALQKQDEIYICDITNILNLRLWCLGCHMLLSTSKLLHNYGCSAYKRYTWFNY